MDPSESVRALNSSQDCPHSGPTLESCTSTLVLVQKSNKKATLLPLLKIYNYLCVPALELKLFTKTKNVKDHLQKSC